MNFQKFALEFTKDGALFQEAELQTAISALTEGQYTDVLIFSHGWNNDIADANNLYDAYFNHATKLLEAGKVPALTARKLAAITIFWPSKKFTDEDLIPGGGAVALDDAIDEDRILHQLEELKNDPVCLGARNIDPKLSELVDQAKALLPELENDEAAQKKFVELIRATLDAAEAHAEDGSDEFFTEEPEKIISAFSQPVFVSDETSGVGGAAEIGTNAAGLLGDWSAGIKAGVRRLLNYATYYKMKERAGIVGRCGLAPALKRLHAALPLLKIHLIGHSFGGRLVTAAANALGDDTKIQTMTLLQAAYSHYGLASKFDGSNDGAFRGLITRGCVTGPICITYTHNDKAVGIAYPLASRFARYQASALGDANDPYGGMGRNGAQRTPETNEQTLSLLSVGQNLTLQGGQIHNLECSNCISDHGDVANDVVVYLNLTAVAST